MGLRKNNRQSIIITMGGKTLLIDLEGTLLLGENAIHGAAEFVSKHQSLGNEVFVLSNTSKWSSKYITDLLEKSGIKIPTSNIITGAKLTISELKKQNIRSVCVLGNESFINELKDSGLDVISYDDHEGKAIELFKLNDNVQAVVVAEDFKYNFNRATLVVRYMIEKNATFYCVGGDSQVPEPKDYLSPGAYALASAPITATNIIPTVIGKPNLSTVLEFIPKSEETWVIGDNADIDVKFANEAGFKSALVLTGLFSKKEAEENQNKPTIIIPNLEALNI